MSSGILALLNSSIPCRIKSAFSPNISPPPSGDGCSGISDGRPLSAPDPRGPSKIPPREPRHVIAGKGMKVLKGRPRCDGSPVPLAPQALSAREDRAQSSTARGLGEAGHMECEEQAA